MFADLESAVKWAWEQYPGCSFSVKEQADGPTVVSVKGKDGALRTVVYIKKKETSPETKNR